MGSFANHVNVDKIGAVQFWSFCSFQFPPKLYKPQFVNLHHGYLSENSLNFFSYISLNYILKEILFNKLELLIYISALAYILHFSSITRR